MVMKIKRVKTPVEYEYVEIPTPWFYSHWLETCTIYGMITEDLHYQITIRDDFSDKEQIEIEIEPTDEGDSCYFTDKYKAAPKSFYRALDKAMKCIHAIRERARQCT